MQYNPEQWSARKRALAYLSFTAALILGYAWFYRYGMSVYEGVEKTFMGSVQIIIQAMTTTGFGGDAPWASDMMNAFVILAQVTGLFLVFMLFPLFVLPSIRQSMKRSIPTSTDKEDHIVVAGYNNLIKRLRQELTAEDVDHVVVLDDEEQARQMQDAGWNVIHNNPLTETGLTAANTPQADAVLTARSDEDNVDILMTAETLSDARLIATVDDQENLQFLSYAGADMAVSPKRLVARALAAHAASAVTGELEPGTQITDNLELVELPVGVDSSLVGRTLHETDLNRVDGGHVIGMWQAGTFIPHPDPDTEITQSTVLVAAGNEDALRNIQEQCRTTWRHSWHASDGHVVVAGHGAVGSRVAEILRERGEDVRTVDQNPDTDPDVVGDARDEDTLQEAGAADARVIVVTVGSDEDAVFATLVASEISDAKVVVRANQQGKTENLYRAGADYVLPLSAVSGRMLASYLLDRNIHSLHQQIRVVRTEAPVLEGEQFGGVAAAAETGVTVIAVHRGGTVFTDPADDFVFEPGDELIVTGTDDMISAFRDQYC